MPKSRPTRAEVEADVLYAVRDQGVPVAVVAQDLDLSQEDVRRIVRKYERMERNEEERMSKARALTPEQEAEVLARIAAGESQRDIAESYGVSQATISTTKKRAREGAEVKETIIAGDKANGILKCVGADTYDGTCKRSNGRMSRKTFRASGARHAQKSWERWCEELRSEDAEGSRPVDVTPVPEAAKAEVPVEPEEPRHVNVVDVQSVTLDVTDRFDESLPLLELLDALEPRDPEVNDVSMDAVAWMMLIDMVRKAVTPRPAEMVESLPFEPVPVYLTYVEGKGPHAAFHDMGKARQVCDTMNAALSFAGVDAKYEVREVPYWEG